MSLKNILTLSVFSFITPIAAEMISSSFTAPSTTLWSYPPKVLCRSGPKYSDHLYNGDFIKDQIVSHQDTVQVLDVKKVPNVSGSQIVPILVPGEKAWRFDLAWPGLETVSTVWIERPKSLTDAHPNQHSKFVQLYSAWVEDGTPSQPPFMCA